MEFVVIGGAAVGGFVIASSKRSIKATRASVKRVFFAKPYTKDDYIEILLLLVGIFYKIRKQGLISVEDDIEKPSRSPLFTQYPRVLENREAIHLITDTLRTVMTTTIASYDLEALIDKELESFHSECMAPAHRINAVADGLPGLGIVAAVMGVVLSMSKIKESPEVLGASIGSALVGTFIGVLLCYGYIGPLARNMEGIANEDMQYLNVIKTALLAFIGSGLPPKVAAEFARRSVPADIRPNFIEMEKILGKKYWLQDKQSSGDEGDD